LEAKLDLGFVRKWAQDLYADWERPSIDPVIFFKLQLVMFFRGDPLRPPAQRDGQPQPRPSPVPWLHVRRGPAGSFEPDPHPTALGRRHLRFFQQVVELYQEAGLVWGRELCADATKVEASADLESLVPRFYQQVRSHGAYHFVDDDLTDPAKAEPAAAAHALPAGVVRLPSAAGNQGSYMNPPPWRLLEEWRLDPNRPAVDSYRRTTDFRDCRTDPDSTPMRAKTETLLGYHDHDVVDGSEARIILAALVTPS
jgi:hypothetical protein